jgi:hypothetical protein
LADGRDGRTFRYTLLTFWSSILNHCLLVTIGFAAVATQATAQSVTSPAQPDSHKPTVVGIGPKVGSNRLGVDPAPPEAPTKLIFRQNEIVSDSTGPSAAHDAAIGAAIGGAIGFVGGIIASRKKQSIEVDLGTNGYVLVGVLSGVILGAIGGLLVHVSR